MVSRITGGPVPVSSTTPTTSTPAAKPATPATSATSAPTKPAGWGPKVSGNASVDGKNFKADGSATLGSNLSATGNASGTLSNDGIASATATAALKALLGGTTLDASGNLSIKNNSLTQAQFQAAVTTLLGPNAKVTANGTVNVAPPAVSADVAANFKATYGNTQIDAGGTLSLKNGAMSGDLAAKVQATLGGSTLISNDKIVFKDGAFGSASLDNQLVSKFGSNASLATTFQASLDDKGLQSATATAAFKALLGNSTLDTTGTQLQLKGTGLSQAQLQAAVTTVLGPNAKVSANGTVSLTPPNVAASVAANFKATYGSTQIDADGSLSVKNGAVSGQLSEQIKATLGNETVIANNKVVFSDTGFQSADLNDELISKFGKSASLDTVFKGSVDAQGLQSATATAAFKALLGNSSIDTTGSGLTIKNNGLSQAQFQAAVQTVFGPNAKLSSSGSFTYAPGQGVSANLVEAFKGSFGALQIDANGSLAVKDGKMSGQLAENLSDVLGKSTVVANNQVTFKDNSFQSATLDDSLTQKFGPNASLTGVFQASVDQHGIATATATAAFKALLGGTRIDTTGTGLTIKNNSMDSAQFKAAVQTVFGNKAQLNANGDFAWDAKSGVSGDLAASFKAAVNGVTVDASGNLSVKNGHASGQLAENLKAVLGDNTLVANNQVVFKDNGFQSATLNDELTHKFGKSASLDTTFKASIDSTGVTNATATAAFKALLGSTSIDTTGTGLTIKNNSLDSAQFKAAVQTVFGDKAQLNASGDFVYDAKSGVSGDLVASFKKTSQALTVDANGNLSVKNGQVSGSLQENLKAVLGSNTLVANNQVVFKNNEFQTATLDDQLTNQFGKNASLKTTFQASIDNNGIQSATATAAFKALIGGTSIDTSGTSLTIKNNSLSQAQFQAAITQTFGPNAKLTSNSSFTYVPGQGVNGNVVAAFKGSFDNVTLDAKGNLNLKDGRVSGQVQENLKALLGNSTVVANNQVVFSDTGFQSATLDDQLTHQFGKNASLQSTFQGSINAQGIQSATATASFKALLGGTTIDTTGTGIKIKNNALSEAQFQAAITQQFGPNATLGANGTFTYVPGQGVSADVAANFKATVGNVTLGADGSLSVKNGQVSGQLSEQLKAVLGDSTVVANNKVVFKDGAFASASLDDSLTQKFGKQASLSTTFKATVDNNGLASANATAAFKALLGNTTIDTTGTGLTIKNNKLTQLQFQNAITTQFGPNAKVSANGTFTWTPDSGISANVVGSFKATYGNVQVGADGSLSLKNGQLSGSVGENLQATLGPATVIANNQVVFANGAFQSATLDDELKTKFGDGSSLAATFKATVAQDKLADASLSLSAFKRLKQLGADGSINVQADGSVEIKNGAIDRAEVSALLSVMAGKEVNLTTGGKLVYADGKLDPSFNANLAAAWGNTTLNANGTITLVDGKPQINAQVGALFGGADLKGGANIAINGDQTRIDAKLSSLGSTKLDATGSLLLDKGRLTGASLTTNLVTGGKTPADVGITGLVSITDGAMQAQLKGQINAGIFQGALGVGGSSSVKVFTPGPNDKLRQQAVADGGTWAERDASFDVNASAGLNGTVQIGPVPVTLGFNATGDVKRDVHTITLHPSKDDALAQNPVTVIHTPTSVDQILSMRPGEEYSDSGSQSIGLGGNVSVGYGVGPAAIKAGGSMYYQVNGNLEKDIERLDGNKVRVRFVKQDGKSDVKALTASVGLDASKIPGVGDLAAKAAPIVNQVAQAGISAQWSAVKQNDTVFDATIDLSTAQGQAAMQHILKNELSETQYWSGFKDSGVTLNKSVSTNIDAHSKKVDINLSVLNHESMSQFLDRQQATTTPNDFTMTEAVDSTSLSKPFFPWDDNKSQDVRFVHETKVTQTGELPGVGDVKTTGTMAVHLPPATAVKAPTLDDTEALLGLRVQVGASKTSAGTLEKNLDPALGMLQQMGFKPEEYQKLADFRAALSAGVMPSKKPIIPIFGGIGDQRFAQTNVDVEGFVGPKGFSNVFSGANGKPRTADDFQRAYLDSAGSAGSLVSTAGTQAAIAKTLGATLNPGANGSYDVVKNGQKIGNLSAADLESIRQGIVGLQANGASNDLDFSAKLKLNSGTWVSGKAPDPIVSVNGNDWGNASDVIANSKKFATTMGQMQTLWQANQPPPKSAGETDAAYADRLSKWQDSSLYKEPDAFYNQLDQAFRNVVGQDKSPNSALAVLKMAGPDGIYARASVTIQPDVAKDMIDAGRANVQRFGAVDLLAQAGGKVDNQGNIAFVPAPANQAQLMTAAKMLFGDGVQATNANGSLVLKNLKYPSGDMRQGLTTLLNNTHGTTGGWAAPSNLSAQQQQQALQQVFGKSATVKNGNIVFDNTGYGLINFGDALSVFGDSSFGSRAAGNAPPLFPTLTPLGNESPTQNYDLSGLLARHQGSNAHWGEAFNHLEYLRGVNSDLSKTPQAGATDWILQ